MDLKRLLLPFAVLGLAAGCSSAGIATGPTPGPDRPAPHHRLDFDPERYVRDYRSPMAEDRGAMVGVPAPGTKSGSVASTTAASRTGEVAPKPPVPPGPGDNNTFVDHGDHPFVPTVDQATSTFGLDVDSGSLTVGRALLAEGMRPPAASVRTEEWVNALGSDQPDPGPADLGLTIDGADAPFATDGTRLLRIGVAGRDIARSQQPTAHLTFVVDTSGSMDIRNRLGLVQSSLALLVDQLRDDDTISIVTFSDDASVLLEPTPVSDSATIVAAIDGLRPGNSTNLEAGLRKGYDQAHQSFDPKGTNAVILASDGVANVGLTDPNGLAGDIARRGREGIHLVTVGYGMGGYNDDLMEQVADRGDGFYAYLDTFDQAKRFFGDRLTSTLSVVASDAKAQVRFDPAVVSSYRLVGYENRGLTTEQFDDAYADAGEIGAGHRVTALYEIRLTDGATVGTDPGAGTATGTKPGAVETPRNVTPTEPPGDPTPRPELALGAELGTVAVRYRNAAGEQVTLDHTITRAEVTRSFRDAPAAFRLAAATADFAEWLASAPTSAELGYQVGDLKQIVDQAATELPASGLPGSVVTPRELSALMAQAATATDTPGIIED